MAGAAKKKVSFGTSMGVSSIIAILVILVLVVFSALSITTSKADLKLSQKTSDGVIAYYNADSAAEDMMAEIAGMMNGSNWQSDVKNAGCEVSTVDGSTVISYTIPVDEFRKLNVELVADQNGKLTRKLWQVVPANAWVPDDSISVFIP